MHKMPRDVRLSSPSPELLVTETQIVPQLLIIPFSPPADLRRRDERRELHVFGHGGKPVSAWERQRPHVSKVAHSKYRGA